jgi:hypothetical protein
LPRTTVARGSWNDTRHRLGESGGGQRPRFRHRRAVPAFGCEQQQGDRHEQRRGQPACRAHRSGRERRRQPLAPQPGVEPAPELHRDFDFTRCLQRQHATAHARVVGAAVGAQRQMALARAALPRRRDQAVAEVAIAVAELGTRHRGH